jgi:PhzF family phenazine biosynthesis protein
MDLRFRLLNVFAIEGDPFSGNPLCVFEDVFENAFEDAHGPTDAQMQAWARQFNLSESSFVTAVRPERDEADVRIFTASYEMPFAGHPTLGTAQVVADRLSAAGESVDAMTLHLPAGPIPVTRTADGWQLRANHPRHRDVAVAPGDLAATLGLEPDVLVAGAAQWVDVGVEQLIVQLRDAEAVRACTPVVSLMHEHLSSPDRPPHVYVWAWTGEDTAEARLFATNGSALDEDPATGSACSNLGGWLVVRGRRGLTVTVSQGVAVSRPSRLVLTIDEHGGILLAGRVTEVGAGVVRMGRD